jgi:hypothetical protein
MSRFFVAVLGAVLAVGFGCQSKHDESDHHDMKHDNAKMMSADACSHCAGVQKATADGKCPVCGMQVGKTGSSGMSPSSSSGTQQGAGASAEPASSSIGATSGHDAGQAHGASAGTATPAASGGEDACTHCQGVQTATADGRCPVCGAEVAKK